VADLKLTRSEEESLEKFGRAHSDKLQQFGRSLVSSLYMLVRSAKMYDADNSVFDKPLSSLRDTLNQVIAKEGRVELVGVKDSFYLNNMLVKIDLAAIDNTRLLLAELREKDIGGFTLFKPVNTLDLKQFIGLFSRESTNQAVENSALQLENGKTLGIKISKYSRIQEKLQGANPDNWQASDGTVDRKKYALTVYSRAVFFLTKYLESVRAGKPIDTSKALRIIQDLVDISFERRSHFLGMSTLGGEQDYLVFHQVNVCLMCIVFGCELGLTKAQLRDLGYIALFHDAGMATIPDELAAKKGALTSEERTTIARAPLVSVRNIIKEKGLNRLALNRVVTTFEHQQDYGTPVRDSRGNIQSVVASSSLGVYSRILAICNTYDALTSKRPFRDPYGPEVALMLMWSEMRHKFDPQLLTVFMKVMAIQPIKVLSKKQQAFTLGGV
jgi:HD-GYP domain-containing protein (c-di-GMP phosphodiesterase class II)